MNPSHLSPPALYLQLPAPLLHFGCNGLDIHQEATLFPHLTSLEINYSVFSSPRLKDVFPSVKTVQASVEGWTQYEGQACSTSSKYGRSYAVEDVPDCSGPRARTKVWSVALQLRWLWAQTTRKLAGWGSVNSLHMSHPEYVVDWGLLRTMQVGPPAHNAGEKGG